MPQTVIRVFRDESGGIPVVEWLNELASIEPKAYGKCLQRILQLSHLGHELRRPLADLLRDAIHELRIKNGRVHYRIVYFFCGQNVACLSHGFTKEGKVPDREIDNAIRHKKLVEKNIDRYTAEFEV